MWSDMFLLPPLFAWVIYQYGKGWTAKQVAIMAFVGIAFAVVNHSLLVFTQTVPDPLGWQKEQWSIPIALHFIYMSTFVALAGLFYLSPNVSVRAAVIVSALLGLHIALGTHVVLGILNLWKQWEWCPDFLSSSVLPYLLTVMWLVLSIFAGIAAGWTASAWTALIAIAFLMAVFLFAELLPFIIGRILSML